MICIFLLDVNNGGPFTDTGREPPLSSYLFHCLNTSFFKALPF
jgi:hypothetical protein